MARTNRILVILAGVVLGSPALAQSTRPRMIDRMREMRPNFPNDPPPTIRSVPIPSPIVGGPVVCHSQPVFQPGGLVVDGRYSDGNWNVGFHLGGAEFSRRVVCYPYPRSHWYPYHGYPRYAEYYGDYPFSYSPVGYPSTRYDPRLQAALLASAQASPPPVVEPTPDTPFGWGEWHLKRRELGPAMDAFREHLRATPRDGAALRCLALALLEDGRFPDGVAMLRLAYETRPELAVAPLDSSLFANHGSDRLGWLVRRIATYANQADTASAWLAEAVLMQGQGRKDQARRMLERAIESGLDASIAGPMQGALR